MQRHRVAGAVDVVGLKGVVGDGFEQDGRRIGVGGVGIGGAGQERRRRRRHRGTMMVEARMHHDATNAQPLRRLEEREQQPRAREPDTLVASAELW